MGLIGVVVAARVVGNPNTLSDQKLLTFSAHDALHAAVCNLRAVQYREPSRLGFLMARASKITLASPIHPGEHLRLEMPRLLPNDDLARRTLAQHLDVTIDQLADLLAGKTNITPVWALRLGRVIGPSREFWMDMQRDYDLWKAEQRLQGQIAALTPLKSRRV